MTFWEENRNKGRSWGGGGDCEGKCREKQRFFERKNEGKCPPKKMIFCERKSDKKPQKTMFVRIKIFL